MKYLRAAAWALGAAVFAYVFLLLIQIGFAREQDATGALMFSDDGGLGAIPVGASGMTLFGTVAIFLVVFVWRIARSSSSGT